MDKLIITVVPCGEGHFDTAPDMSIAEHQANAVIEAGRAGAAIGHIHGNMQGASGDPREPDLDHWRELTERIRGGSDLLVQFGRAVMNPKTRQRLLGLKPDMGSF